MPFLSTVPNFSSRRRGVRCVSTSSFHAPSLKTVRHLATGYDAVRSTSALCRPSRKDDDADPSFIGKELPATSHTTRTQWIHSYISPDRTDSTGRTRRDTVVEYLTRVE